MNIGKLIESTNLVDSMLTASITTVFGLLCVIIVSVIITLINRRIGEDVGIGHHIRYDNDIQLAEPSQLVQPAEPEHYNPETNTNLVKDLLKDQFVLYVRENNVKFSDFMIMRSFLKSRVRVNFGDYLFIYRRINIMCHGEKSNITIQFSERSWTVIYDNSPLFTHEVDPDSIGRYKDYIVFCENERSVGLEKDAEEHLMENLFQADFLIR